MYMQQDMQPKLSSSGYGLCKVEEDTARVDSKFQIGSRTSFSKGELVQSNSRDRLVYLTTCLIGHPVEVQVLDGSVFSGVFHATNAEDFGIVLKMARPIKDGSQGQKNISDSPNKPPSRTLIIPAKDLVQVIAKDVPITRDGFTNELQNEKQQDLMTDYCISRSGHVEAGRELERWVPDENDPGCPELENIFDGPWNRGWDQFEANETLFGVKSTFNEELYTTKLERGHQMRELEREALRIAREIEGEETHDLHLAEERGIQLDGYVEIDEETRFSSVYRGNDDSGYDEIEIILLNSRNDETIGGVSGSGIGKTRTDMSSQKASDETQLSLRSSLMGGSQSSLTATRVVHHSRFEGDSEHVLEHSSVIDSNRVHDDKLIGHPGTNYLNEEKEKQKLHDQSLVSKGEGSRPLLGSEKASCGKAGLSPNATAFDPSHVSSRTRENLNSSNELSVDNEPRDMQVTESSLAHLSSFASRTSDHEGAPPNSNDHGLSPGSSAHPFSSEKSTINPHAKEFKLNANADSFIPSQTPLRASSPVADSPFYYPATMTAVTHVHGMPVGVEIGPSFDAQQPVLFCPRAAPVAQPYYHPNGPQYGQQMIVGQLHPGLYMPTYPPEMQYK